MSIFPFLIAIDTGGTFTDGIATDNSDRIYTCKVLSNSSLRGSIEKWLDSKTVKVKNSWHVEKDIFQNYEFRFLSQSFNAQNKDMPIILVEQYDPVSKIVTLNHALPEEYYDMKLSFELTAHEEAPVLAARLITQTPLNTPLPPLLMRLGSTKGTNALLERKGAPTALLVTKGFKDLLKIGNQQRPDLFALEIVKPEPLNQECIEIEERLNADGTVLKSLTFNNLDKKIEKLKKQKIQSVAVALMHAYKNNAHEMQLKAYLKKHFDYVSVSSELSQQIKFLPRAETTIVNTYLAPIIDKYIKNITHKLPDDSLQVMTSAGSLINATLFQPKDSLLSGPAGGIVGAATIGQLSGYSKILTFDMGGTSTDVARFDNDYDYKFDVSIGSATVFSPALNIETVAAGGGSICYFDGFKLCVGPESAGSTPGPACYGAGGPLTITDVNLLLGRLDTYQFGIPVSTDAAAKQLTLLQDKIVQKTQKLLSKEDILNGFLTIANERMADAIKKISVAKGYAPPQYALVAFGGAGGLHACCMASLLGINTILLPKYAGLLSAYGIMHAQIERFAEKQILKTVSQISYDDLILEFQKLSDAAVAQVHSEGVVLDRIEIRKQLMYCRLKGQDATLDTPFDALFIDHFKAKYQTIYGHWMDNREIEIESIRVIAAEKKAEKHSENLSFPSEKYTPLPHHFTKALVENQWCQIPVFLRHELTAGATITGFALLLDDFSSTVIESDFVLRIDENETALIKKAESTKCITPKEHAQSIDLELFINRFTNIAEQMGVMLQRTSLSVNVKERLDFSCALLDTEGYLIANAPHIPVHLGSLGVCVRKVLEQFTLEEGDTIVTNHPGFGGSHLPDVTLITPVFEKKLEQGASKKRLIGYVCNRCHHSEIGGIRPASMPPNATHLSEEGVIISPTYLVKNGVTDWEPIHYTLTHNPYPTRSIQENIADLNAALAANLNGVQSLQALVAEHGIESVHFYMKKLKEYTAEKLNAALKNQFLESLNQGSTTYEATENLDDGTILKVAITFSDNKVVFDFTGTSPVHKGNLNATPAIVNSVVIYVLRLLLKEKIPLNEGIMQNVSLILPENSILNPHMSNDAKDYALLPAVVGGNVETSQRLTDTVLKALGIIACGQGTMNNVLFGNATFGYYETICGGAGAGNGFKGADAVHTHMTNTRITDPEIMEFRYPVRLEAFSIRRGSGGKGRYKGGDGIVRKITFLAPVELSVLSQHRKIAPFGIQGGERGGIGKQYIVLKNGKKRTLKGIDGASLNAGDSFIVKTPGGGGCGEKI